MERKARVLEVLRNLEIPYEIYEHPPLPTISIAMEYWKDIDATHCKNLFFRNHKGNKHYLIIMNCLQELDIHDLEKRLKQGKISFASSERMKKYLGVEAGSVSAFSLINDESDHVHVFVDEIFVKSKKISFHPNINTASVVISYEDFVKFLKWSGNEYEFMKLYE